MKQTKVSVRGQTVIPQEIREELGIKAESKISWWTRDGLIVGMPMPDDPVKAFRGMLKGIGPGSQEVLGERRKDRELDKAREDRLLKQIDQTVKRRRK